LGHEEVVHLCRAIIAIVKHVRTALHMLPALEPDFSDLFLIKEEVHDDFHRMVQMCKGLAATCPPFATAVVDLDLIKASSGGVADAEEAFRAFELDAINH